MVKSNKSDFQQNRNTQSWYRPHKRQSFEYNSSIYQPKGWLQPVRFVAMRMPKQRKVVKDQWVQCELFEDDRYKYRIFCTDLRAKAHKVISQYDKRADVENLVGEAKREGLSAIPSSRFKNNYAYFQIVMLAYNIWRYLKMLAEHSAKSQQPACKSAAAQDLDGIMTNTLRIARLRLLLIVAKVVTATSGIVPFASALLVDVKGLYSGVYIDMDAIIVQAELFPFFKNCLQFRIRLRIREPS
jgi:hypothetical protein